MRREVADENWDFRDGIDEAAETEAAGIGGKFPKRSLRLSTLSKVRLCVEILATNKTQRVLAREHGCTRQAVSYYVRTMLPHRRRIQPIILFKQGELELLFD